MILVILSVSVERVGVSCMWDFHRIGPLGRFGLVVAMSVRCPLFMWFFCVGAGSCTRGNSEESCRRTRKSPKNEELFRIAYMDHPHVGTLKSLVDRLARALKMRSCSGLHAWIVHIWKLGESRQPTRKSPKNKELFQIAYMNCPRMGGVRRVDWCTHRPTRRDLKTRSCSGLHTWIGHTWKEFD